MRYLEFSDDDDAGSDDDADGSDDPDDALAQRKWLICSCADCFKRWIKGGNGKRKAKRECFFLCLCTSELKAVL
jgi:hypothetical protein